MKAISLSDTAKGEDTAASQVFMMQPPFYFVDYKNKWLGNAIVPGLKKLIIEHGGTVLNHVDVEAIQSQGIICIAADSTDHNMAVSKSLCTKLYKKNLVTDAVIYYDILKDETLPNYLWLPPPVTAKTISFTNGRNVGDNIATEAEVIELAADMQPFSCFQADARKQLGLNEIKILTMGMYLAPGLAIFSRKCNTALGLAKYIFENWMEQKSVHGEDKVNKKPSLRTIRRVIGKYISQSSDSVTENMKQNFSDFIRECPSLSPEHCSIFTKHLREIKIL